MEENNSFEKLHCELFLNMIGGHALILKLGNGILAKSANKNEIEFYEFTKEKKLGKIFPQYYGTITKRNYVIEYEMLNFSFNKFKCFFTEFLNEISTEGYNNNKHFIEELKIPNDEDDHQFKKNLETILKCDNHFADNKVKDDNIYYHWKNEIIKLYETKLKWILFWFIKWGYIFNQNDFFIFEDLTYLMELPAIIDIKLDGNLNNHGFRIMGLQCYDQSKIKPSFKHRYDCKYFNYDDIKKYVKLFFTIEKTLIEEMIKNSVMKLNFILLQLKIHKIHIHRTSLLMVYDAKSANIENLKINIIDFSHFNYSFDNFNIDKVNTHNQREINILSPLENFIELLNSLT